MIDLDPAAIRAHAKRLRISPAVLRKLAVKYGVALNAGRCSGRPTIGSSRLTTEAVAWWGAARACTTYPTESPSALTDAIHFELQVRDAQVRAARRGR